MIVLLWGFLSCARQDPVQQELMQLHDRTIPAGANLVEKSRLIRNDFSATATWIFETDMDWESYTTWVTSNLPTYTLVSGRMKLRLLKKLAGDIFELQIEPSITGNAQRIRVNFQAHPY